MLSVDILSSLDFQFPLEISSVKFDLYLINKWKQNKRKTLGGSLMPVVLLSTLCMLFYFSVPLLSMPTYFVYFESFYALPFSSQFWCLFLSSIFTNNLFLHSSSCCIYLVDEVFVELYGLTSDLAWIFFFPLSLGEFAPILIRYISCEYQKPYVFTVIHFLKFWYLPP